MAASATFALKAGVWFRRGRLFIVSPDSRGTACPLSGRNSTYRPVQILEAGSDGVAPLDALVGPLLDTCLHEFAHAIFEMLRVPVLGREEDAADQLSAYVILSLGKAEARWLIGGVSYAHKTEADAATAPLAMTQFADAHGTPAQRFYNVLCIAFGADAQLFGDFVEKGHLPKERAEDCKDEYQQVANAYEKLIGPYVDHGLAKEVFDKTWLPDPTIRVRRTPGSPPK
jgi:hypothetical protein